MVAQLVDGLVHRHGVHTTAHLVGVARAGHVADTKTDVIVGGETAAPALSHAEASVCRRRAQAEGIYLIMAKMTCMVYDISRNPGAGVSTESTATGVTGSPPVVATCLRFRCSKVARSR